MDFENIRIKDIDLFVRYTPRKKQSIARNRTNHIIGVKLSGADYHDFGYQTFTLEENSIYFFNQRDDYDVKIQDVGTVMSVHFTTTEPVETDSFCIKIKNRAEIVNILEKIEHLYTHSAHSDSMMMSCLYKLCAVYSDIRRKTYSPHDKRIEEAREYIATHYKDEDCLDVAARLYGTKRRRFNEVFHRQLNMTPNRYLTSCRMNFAKELLVSGSFSVSDVAVLCGYKDIYYFSKVFKTEMGVNPGKYKEYINKKTP